MSTSLYIAALRLKRLLLLSAMADKAVFPPPRFSCSDQFPFDRPEMRVLLLEASVANGARTVATWFPLTAAAYEDENQRSAISNFAADSFREDVPNILFANQNIVGPTRGKLPR